MLLAGPGKDGYNKTVNAGKGTLIQNWQEEAVLRETTGIGRAMVKAHIVKKHDEIYSKPTQELEHVYGPSSTQTDYTFERVFGLSKEPNYTSETKSQFAQKPSIKTGIGKRYELIQKQFLDVVNQELTEKEQQEEINYNQRTFNTTYGHEFVKKDPAANTVGRRVMKDQDGQAVPPDRRDIDLLCEHGFLKPTPLATDEELKNMIKPENYVTSKPITFYTEKLNDGVFYGSKVSYENNAFAKNNEFVKTFHGYKHVKL